MFSFSLIMHNINGKKTRKLHRNVTSPHDVTSLSRDTTTNFNVGYFAPYYYVVIIKYTAITIKYYDSQPALCRSQWLRGLRSGTSAVSLLGLRVRIPPGAWMSVSCECCVLSGRGLCVGLITRPEQSYRMWCDWVWSWSLDNEEALAH